MTKLITFDVFANLKVLSLFNPLTEKFYKYISKSTLKLETFETRTNEKLLSNISRSFWKSPALRSLKTLSFGLDPELRCCDTLHRHFLEGIGSLEKLESLTMTTPLDMEWCLQFSHSKLQSLEWFIERPWLLGIVFNDLNWAVEECERNFRYTIK
jgi:hypothetical protein